MGYLGHFNALARKNLSLQGKRKAQTCCQLFIPISIAIVIGVMQSLYMGATNDWDSQTSWQTTGVEYSNMNDINYDIVLYSNTSSSFSSMPLGSLNANGKHNKGFLGILPQMQVNGIYQPAINYGGSPEDIDDYFYNTIQSLYPSCRQNGWCNYQNATAAINFNNLDISSTSLNLDYVVQSGNINALLNGWDYDVNGLGDVDYDNPQLNTFYINTINNALIKQVLGNHSGILAGFTTMPYVEKDLPSLMGNLISFLLLPFGLSFLFPVYMNTIVQEKKEGLVQKITSCGLSMKTYWVVNFLYNYMLFLLISITLFAFGYGFGVQVFRERTFTLILLWLLWGLAQVSMCHFFTCFISSPNLSLLVGFLLSIFGSICGLALEVFLFLPHPERFPAFGYMFYPGFVFYHGFGLLILSLLDPNSANLASLAPGSMFSYMLIILAAQTIIFFILTWYLEAIFPRDIGVRRHPLFPIYDLIERLKKKKDTPEGDDGLEETAPLIIPVDLMNYSSVNGEVEKREKESEDVKRESEIAYAAMDAMVRVLDVSKIYKGQNRNPDKVALSKVTFHIKKNECFGLLGPNGAGKTTLLNVLSGFHSASSGVAFIGDFDIKTDMHKVHKFLGIVPQFDVLWGELTVREHLLFYLRVKSTSVANVNNHVKEIIEQVGLEEVENRPASGLSGGQKRRLSIAIAMMGNPKLILMDEPTTGLDPSNRRALWDIVAKAKENHSIVISTHSMEEAEVLCSRIGIMRKSKLHSIGTPMELKEKFGLGYNVKLSHFLNCEEKAHTFIMQVIPNASLVQAYGDLRAYKVNKGDFVLSELFKTMERNKFRYGIKEWSISQASLEEVFLAIVTEDEAESS